jgi:hypothetical protein
MDPAWAIERQAARADSAARLRIVDYCIVFGIG